MPKLQNTTVAAPSVILALVAQNAALIAESEGELPGPAFDEYHARSATTLCAQPQTPHEAMALFETALEQLEIETDCLDNDALTRACMALRAAFPFLSAATRYKPMIYFPGAD